MKRLSAGIAALTILGAASAQAQSDFEKDTANFLPRTGDELADLIRDCSSPECFSYVSGVINGITVYSYLTENPSPFCSGEEVRSNDIRDAIVGVVNDTPRLGRAAAPASILTAFSRNWPCTTTGAEAVANDLDGAEAEEDLISYTDLAQVDMDQLLDFISRKSFVFSMGDPSAPLEKTLHVFHDPNCEYCSVLTDELDSLVAEGWRAIIYPISNVSDASKGYAAVQIAVRDSDSGAPEALFRNRAEGKDITAAMTIAQEAGMAMPEILELLAASAPYQLLEANNRAYEAFGATEAPTWILGDRMASGITDADEIMRIQATMNSAPVPVAEDPVVAEPASEEPTSEKAAAEADPAQESSNDANPAEESSTQPKTETKALRPGIEKAPE